MINVFNPDDWKDIAILAFLGLCSVVSAGIPVWHKLKRIDDQVSNYHDENLRDEITRGFREIREDIKILRDEHRELRKELHTERQERIEGDRR